MCVHIPGADETWCASCKEGPIRGEVKAAKPDRLVSVDPTLELAEGIASGKLCAKCHVAHKPIGCNCSRRRHADFEQGLATEWGRRELAAFSDHPLVLRSAVTSAVTRVSRRGGVLREELHHPVREVRQALDPLMPPAAREPKWFPPRTQEADFLPV